MRFRTAAAALVAVLCLAPLAALAQPTVAFPPGVDGLIGTDVTFDVTFSNSGPTAYGPYLEFVLDAGGVDLTTASLPCDGVTFASAVVTDRNPTVPLIPIQTGPVAPCTSAPATFPHPFNGLGTVSLAPGQQHVVVPLPFGSVVPNQDPITVAVTLSIHSYADDNAPLHVSVGGGFRYGLDPLDNPGSDPPLPVASGTMVVTPHVLIVHKTLNAPEGETVSGPNYGYSFTVSVDIAPGQTVTNLHVHDCAATTALHLVGFNGTPPMILTVTPPNCFDTTLPSVTGPATAPYTAVSITASFWLDIVLPTKAPSCETPVTNATTVTGDWLPLDTRDQGPVPVGGTDSVSWPNKALAIQKTASAPPPGPVPGSIVTYVLNFELSDYLAAGDIHVTDLLSDGQTFLGGTFNVSDQYGTTAGPLPASAVTVTRPVIATFACDASPVVVGGSSQLDFDISAAMQALGTNASHQGGVLTGGFLGSGGGPALGTITFTAQVDDAFATTHSATDDGFVDKHDQLYDRAEVRARILRKIGSRVCSDDTRACLTVPGETFAKRVIARNGQLFSPIPTPLPPPPLPQFTSHDNVTFSIEKTLLTGDAEDLVIDDWFPLPAVTNSSVIAAPLPPCSGALPLQNKACYESTAVFATPNYQPLPNNGVRFTLGTTNNPANTPVTIEVRITLPITGVPMADGLLQTNDAEECEHNSFGDEFCKGAIAQLQIAEPNLRIHKAILCADPGCAPLIPEPTGVPAPVQLRRPGGGGTGSLVLPKPICPAPGCNARFSGTVHSNNLASILGTTSVNLDAGDKFSFVIAIENIGSGPHGAFDVKLTDTLPPNFPATIVPNSICVNYGDGTPAPHLPILPAPNGFTVELDDAPSLPNGALAAYSPSSGRNLVLITFDLVMLPPLQVPIGSCSDNTATLDSYSNADGGPDFVAAGYAAGTTASAGVCVRPTSLKKVLTRTSEAHTAGGGRVAIGEVVQYLLTFDVPEGTASPFTVVDTLPNGFQYLGNLSVAQSGGLTYSGPSVTTVGNQVTFDFGTLTNPHTDRACETLTIVFNALVLNDPAANPNGSVKSNHFEIFANNVSAGVSPVVNTTIVRPLLTIAKSGTQVISSGGTIQYNVTFANAGSTTAFDVRFTDPAPPSVAWSGAVTTTSNPANCATSLSGSTVGNSVVVSAGRMPPNCSVTATFSATPLPSNPCPSLVHNTGSVVYTSLPGPNGTTVNPTGSATPGASGALNGELQETVSAADDTYCVIGAGCDLWLGKTHSTPSGQVVPGQQITFTLTVDVPPGSNCGCPTTLQDILPSWLLNPVIGPMPPGWTQTSSTPFIAKTTGPLPTSSVFTITGTVSTTVHSGDTLNNCFQTECMVTNVVCDWFVVP